MRRLSYILIVCSCLFLLSAGYYFSYHIKPAPRQPYQKQQTQETDHTLQTSYLIQISNGKVIIRHSDGSIYETTDITEDSLPATVRQKIKEEYRLYSSQELYSFLENYSS